MKCLILILAALCGVILATYRIDPLVSTKVGLIKGLRDENGYAKFLGVPYGKVGSNVFGAAKPHPPFENIFEAYDDSATCPQVGYLSGVAKGSIDCLKLNIYVPDSASSHHPLPVMVWIYGGAFIGGSAIEETSNPITLLKHDVIVVAINYRIGVFGFMCLDIPEVPGNTGLKDQALALRWINQNIEAFGGNANQITIFGESAGGMSTNLHLFSLNEKLFQRAIIESGPALTYWMMVESNQSIPFRISERLGFNTTDIHEALSFLMNQNILTIAQTAYDLLITKVSDTIQPLTKPCVERKFEGIEQFLTEHPMNIKPSKLRTISVIIGYNNNEFAMEFANADAEFFDTYDFSKLFALGFNMDNDLDGAIADVKHFYFGDDDITDKFRWTLTDFGSDFIFNHPTQRTAQRLLESGSQNVYTYVFSYDNRDFGINKTCCGAGHGEELFYLFDKGQGEKTPEVQAVIDRLGELWTNFAKYGNPTPQTTELLPVKWTPITKTYYNYLAIDSDISLQTRPFHDRMAFWDLFYKQYGRYQKWYKD